MTRVATPFEDLLDESADAARRRAAQAFSALTGDRPVVLYGAGGAGRAALSALLEAGAPPAACADRRAAPGESIGGIPLLTPTDAAERFGEEAVFVVTVVNPDAPFRDTAEELQALGCRIVVPYTLLAWAYPDRLIPRYAVDMPDGPLAQADDVRAAFRLLADDASRDEFAEQVRWRLDGDTGRLGAAHAPLANHYFEPDLFKTGPDEVFVDVGAYDGDTVRSVLAATGGRFAHLVALEPDPANFAALEAMVAGLPEDVRDRIDVRPLAASDRAGMLRFEADGTTSAALSDTGNLEVEAVRLDDLLADVAPTILKMDIEGAEPLALAGAEETIRRHRPVLAICVYHVQEQLWTIPLQVARIVGDGYRLYLRRYAADFYDEVLYAVPDERHA